MLQLLETLLADSMRHREKLAQQQQEHLQRLQDRQKQLQVRWDAVL